MVDSKNKWTVFVGVWSPNPKRTPIVVGAVSKFCPGSCPGEAHTGFIPLIYAAKFVLTLHTAPVPSVQVILKSTIVFLSGNLCTN